MVMITLDHPVPVFSGSGVGLLSADYSIVPETYFSRTESEAEQALSDLLANTITDQDL